MGDVFVEVGVQAVDARHVAVQFVGKDFAAIEIAGDGEVGYLGMHPEQRLEITGYVEVFARGWIIGGKEYKKDLSEELKRMQRGRSWGREELREMNEFFWERQLTECLEVLRKSEADIGNDLKSARWKIAIACWLKQNTSASNGWRGQHLGMGIASAVSRNVAQLQRSGPRRYADYRKVEKYFKKRST